MKKFNGKNGKKYGVVVVEFNRTTNQKSDIKGAVRSDDYKYFAKKCFEMMEDEINHYYAFFDLDSGKEVEWSIWEAYMGEPESFYYGEREDSRFDFDTNTVWRKNFFTDEWE